MAARVEVVADDAIDIGSVIGQGSSGKVFKGTWRGRADPVPAALALKVTTIALLS
jgi:hypothetical protein